MDNSVEEILSRYQAPLSHEQINELFKELAAIRDEVSAP